LISTDTGVTLGLLVNELVSNSLKYAFRGKDEGELKITFINNNENNQVLEISDNGIGLSSNIDIINSNTLGFLLIKSFVEQLHGNIEIILNNGILFRIAFIPSLSSKDHL
jgi:two-component sensor histidine kinase